MGAKSFIEKKLTEHNLSAKCAQFFLGQWRMTGLDNEDKFVVAENRQVKIIERIPTVWNEAPTGEDCR